MARWELRGKAYLNIPGATYTAQEQSLGGTAAARTYHVPTFLDADDPAFHRPRQAGVITLSNTVEGATPHDYVFSGPPIPEMIPLDDEAKAISAKHAPEWEKLGGFGESYDEKLIEGFWRQMAAHHATQMSSTPSGGVEAVQKENEELRAQVALLSQRVVEAPAGEPRRV